MLTVTTWDPYQEKAQSPAKGRLVLPAAGYSSMRFGQSLGGDPAVVGWSLGLSSHIPFSLCLPLQLSSLDVQTNGSHLNSAKGNQHVDMDSIPRQSLIWRGASQSSILAWIIPWTQEPGRLQSIESDTTEVTQHARNPQGQSSVAIPSHPKQKRKLGKPHHGHWIHLLESAWCEVSVHEDFQLTKKNHLCSHTPWIRGRLKGLTVCSIPVVLNYLVP